MSSVHYFYEDDPQKNKKIKLKKIALNLMLEEMKNLTLKYNAK